MAKNRISEELIEKKIYNSLKKKYKNINRQVKLHMKRVDVAYESDDMEIIGLEVKISDWRGALKQAWTNKLACHKSYVALWHEYEHRVDVELFESAGVGLIVVDGNFILSEKISASKEHTLNPEIHQLFIKEITV